MNGIFDQSIDMVFVYLSLWGKLFPLFTYRKAIEFADTRQDLGLQLPSVSLLVVQAL